MGTQKTFAKGSFAPGSHVAFSRTVSIPTSTVSLPKRSYGQAGGRRKKKGR